MFKEISCVFNFSDINEINKKTANAIEKVGQGAKAARHLPIPVVKDIADIVSNLFEDYANFLKGNEKDKTLKEIKDKIDNELRKNKIRLIITINDFDRLSQREIRLMFQIIKILGDFQNTIYLLLMDRDVVVSSLKDVQGGDGEDYLKK